MFIYNNKGFELLIMEAIIVRGSLGGRVSTNFDNRNVHTQSMVGAQIRG